MAIFPSTAIPSGADTGYTIDYSCRFDDGDSAKLTWTPSGSGDSLTTWTFSCWYKRGNLGGIQGIFGVDGNSDTIDYDANGSISFYSYSGGYVGKIQTSAAYYRDPTAWYNLVCVWDTGNATSGDRIRAYINGVRITSWGATTEPAEDAASAVINTATEHHIGKRLSSSQYFDGYLAEMQFIDGAALTPASFGESGDYGEWKPIEYTGSYGTNGFHLDFADSAALGNDVSGNDNDWTVTNLVAADQMLDTPTNNFCTLNPLANTVAVTLSEGNLKTVPTFHSDKAVWSTFGFNSGKWYVEVRDTLQGNALGGIVGISNTHHAGYLSSGDDNAWVRMGNGVITTTGTDNGDIGSSGATGDIFTFAIDADIGSVWFAKNAAPDTSTTAQATGLPTSNLPRDYRFGEQVSNAPTYVTMNFNFGQDSSFAGEETAQGNQDSNDIGDFYYTPPTDFLALCTSNLPEPAVIPSEHFNTVLYTGNASTNAITVGFQPDFTWIKKRSGADNHALYNVLVATTNYLRSDTDQDERTNGSFSFDTDGFSLTNDDGSWNASSETYVGWNWLANGSGSANTVGDIASTVSVNTDAGFSIVSYEGNATISTVGHGLSKAPELIINKPRTFADHWNVDHKNNQSAGTGIIYLNRTNAGSTNSNFWDDTAPTSSVFTIGSVDGINKSGEDFINYCFHSVDGYSKVGSYEGNGAVDGTFVYTGFRPAFVLLKNTEQSQDWQIYDTKRSTSNLIDDALYPNTNGAEATANYLDMDIISNGFKLRVIDGANNVNNEVYIYLAFAETPFKYSNAR